MLRSWPISTTCWCQDLAAPTQSTTTSFAQEKCAAAQHKQGSAFINAQEVFPTSQPPSFCREPQRTSGLDRRPASAFAYEPDTPKEILFIQSISCKLRLCVAIPEEEKSAWSSRCVFQVVRNISGEHATGTSHAFLQLWRPFFLPKTPKHDSFGLQQLSFFFDRFFLDHQQRAPLPGKRTAKGNKRLWRKPPLTPILSHHTRPGLPAPDPPGLQQPAPTAATMQPQASNPNLLNPCSTPPSAS